MKIIHQHRKVFVVTVTYGNRFHFLKQVIDSALNNGVYKVIIVDNFSEPESRNKLMEYEKALNGKIKVLYLNYNYGSAGGFKRGLKEAKSDPECEFIWLLDDDNKPLDGSLEILMDFWNSLEIEDKEEKVALLSFRFKRQPLAKEAINRDQPELVLGLRNSFLGFHVKELHKKIWRYLKRNLKLRNQYMKYDLNKYLNKPFGIVPVAPYGGLFIHKAILDKIGYPNENLYLYEDDHEWTYRITKSGGKIYLILDSKIEDLEMPWYFRENPRETNFSIIAKSDPYRVYYGVRNRVFFEINNLVDNRIIYWSNVFVYLLLISFSSRRNIRLIIKAIKDGYKGKLGNIELTK
jgi:GT2 family glycosyltransferase